MAVSLKTYGSVVSDVSLESVSGASDVSSGDESIAADMPARASSVVKRALQNDENAPPASAAVFSPGMLKLSARSPGSVRAKRERYDSAGGTPARARNLVLGMFSQVKPRSGALLMDVSRRQSELQKLTFAFASCPMMEIMKETLRERIDLHSVEKCMTVVGVSVATLTDAGTVVFSDKLKVVEETFWSSAESKPGLVGVNRAAIEAAKGKESVPISDHHSERAALQWLSTHLSDLVSDVDKDSIVTIFKVTSFSSCSDCAGAMGTGKEVSRAADVFRSKVAGSPHVAIVHQGLLSFSAASKKLGAATTRSEVRFSSSLVEKMLSAPTKE